MPKILLRKLPFLNFAVVFHILSIFLLPLRELPLRSTDQIYRVYRRSLPLSSLVRYVLRWPKRSPVPSMLSMLRWHRANRCPLGHLVLVCTVASHIYGAAITHERNSAQFRNKSPNIRVTVVLLHIPSPIRFRFLFYCSPK
jgi:hypothetical protein